MRKLMAIFAHPDDEGAAGGTLVHYANNGVEVSLVCTTRGEVGEISNPALATPETLGEVRQKELEVACRVLGIKHLRFLDRRDSGMDGTPENEDPRALVQANPDEVKAQLVGIMQELQPDVVITFEPFGWYGHPDHIAVSRWVTELLGEGGDEDWYPQRFFHSVIPFSKFGKMVETAVAQGYLEDGGGIGDNLPAEQLMKTETAVTHVIDVLAEFDTKQSGMNAHKTQFGEDNMFIKIPRDLMIEASGHEYFIQIFPPPAEGQSENRLTDLFAGV